MRTCDRIKCDALAIGIPVIRIPAIGGGTGENETLRAELKGVSLCPGHLQSANAGEFLTGRLRATINRVCKATGKVKPDFRRAFIECGPFPEPSGSILGNVL